MGCTPSRRHRQIGLIEHDHFHSSSVLPMGLYPGMDSLSRSPFISEAAHQPVGMVIEEPPPYTELPINGHISMMTGQSPYKHFQDIQQLPANTSTTNDMSLMDTTNYQGNTSEDQLVDTSQLEREYVEDMLRGASPVHDQSYSSSCEASHLSWSFSGYQDLQTELQHSSQQRANHTLHETSVFPHRTHRSRSVDTAALPYELEQSQMDDTRLTLTPSPMCDNTDIDNPITTHHITHVQESRTTENSINEPFPVRPGRLPPLQPSLTNDVQAVNDLNNHEQHRRRKRRKKRRRGHSWHGEAVSELSTQQLTSNTSSNMSTVVE